MAKQDINVRQLVDKVISGEIALPEMQRRYVWTSTKVRDLFDSLYRGYPSGAILVWETDGTLQDRSLQITGITTNPLTSRILLLDGQQRLTSLTAILTGKPIKVRNKKRDIEIFFNLNHPDGISDTELQDLDRDDDEADDDDDDIEDNVDIMEEMRKRTFVVGARALKNDPHWISVSDVFEKSESQLLKPLGINSDDENWDRYSERIRKLRKIEDYQYQMYVLDRSMSYEEVTEIFVRVNSLGTKLRGSDLALAQITSKWKGFMKELEEFSAEFEHNQDYLMDSGILVKTLIVFATGQSKFKTVHRITLPRLQEAWKQTKEAIRYAISLLRSNVRIDNLKLLASPFLLIPIAYYSIKKNQRPTNGEIKKLLLWFYVAHMKSRYGASSESRLDQDISALGETGDLDQLLATLRQQFKDVLVTPEDLAGKGRRSSYFSMLFFILKQSGARDWLSGVSISERLHGKSQALQFHHIFPKAVLRAQKIAPREINEIANLAFIGGRTNRNISMKEPEKYLPEILTKHDKDILADHLIPCHTELWKVQHYPHFLEERRRMIAERINSFLKEFDG